MRLIIWLFSFLLPVLSVGQKNPPVNKYTIGLAIEVGHSFPNFDREQERWEGTFYPTGGLQLMFQDRISERWAIDLGLGITGYALANKGSVDQYVLDFASPKMSSGISYHFRNRRGQEHVLQLLSGFQLSYQGTFEDEFDTYTVKIAGKHKFNPFIRPAIGVRKSFKRKMKGSRYPMAYEMGTFFRYNFRTLGTAQIIEQDFEVILEPRGNIIGGYFKILIPAGKKRLRIKKERAPRWSPIIYNPRFLAVR